MRQNDFPAFNFVLFPSDLPYLLIKLVSECISSGLALPVGVEELGRLNSLEDRRKVPFG